MPAIAPRAVPRRHREPADEGRRDLRDRGEGQQADRGEARLAGEPGVDDIRAAARRRIAARRISSTRAPLSPAAGLAAPPSPRRISGITRSLETVIDTATLSTTTMPVAAETPPIMVSSADAMRVGVERQGENRQIAV